LQILAGRRVRADDTVCARTTNRRQEFLFSDLSLFNLLRLFFHATINLLHPWYLVCWCTRLYPSYQWSATASCDFSCFLSCFWCCCIRWVLLRRTWF
jgi:hypothetical protein